MMKAIRAFAALLLLSGLAALPAMASIRVADDKSASTSGRTAAQIQEDVQKALKDSKFKNVTVHVANGVVTLSGTVDLYAYKEEADRKVHHARTLQVIP